MVFPKGLIRTRYRRDCSLRRTSTVAQCASKCFKNLLSNAHCANIAATLFSRDSCSLSSANSKTTGTLLFFSAREMALHWNCFTTFVTFCQICAYYACFAPSCTPNDTFIVKENQLSCTSSMYLTKDTLLRDRKRRKIAQHLTGIEPMA